MAFWSLKLLPHVHVTFFTEAIVSKNFKKLFCKAQSMSIVWEAFSCLNERQVKR